MEGKTATQKHVLLDKNEPICATCREPWPCHTAYYKHLYGSQ